MNILKLPQDISKLVLEQQNDFDDAVSFVSSQNLMESEDSEIKHRVVRLEEISNGLLQFECPYCRASSSQEHAQSGSKSHHFGMIGFLWRLTRSPYRKNVFSDLRAYVCNFKDCRAGLLEDRRAWFQHELEDHRRRWMCQMCSQSFGTSSDFEEHLRRAHISRVPLPEIINSMVAASSRPIAALRPYECPLCDEWYTQLRSQADKEGIDAQQAIAVTEVDFRRHLGDHLEQVALFAIPPKLDAQSISGSH